MWDWASCGAGVYHRNYLEKCRRIVCHNMITRKFDEIGAQEAENSIHIYAAGDVSFMPFQATRRDCKA